MRAKEFLKLIKEQTDPDALEGLKSIILNKIKELPAEPETQDILDEMNAILSSVKIGTNKKATLSQDFKTWTDKDVVAAKDLLARYVASLDAPIPYKKSMIQKWKAVGLINVDVLISGRHTMNEIVTDYDSNPAIKEIADDLIQVASLGKGKGEFFLQVLSPRISSPGKSGDLYIEGTGEVEVKTNHSGAPRFTDRAVSAGSKFRMLSEKFLEKYVSDPNSTENNVTVKTGLNIDQLYQIYQTLDLSLKNQFSNDLQNILEQIFIKAKEYPGTIVNRIISGKIGEAKQLYSAGILKNYLGFKETNKGFLYIDLNSGPTFVFFTDNDTLNKAGLRLHAGTIYPVSTQEVNAFPQIRILDTKKAQPSLIEP